MTYYTALFAFCSLCALISSGVGAYVWWYGSERATYIQTAFLISTYVSFVAGMIALVVDTIK